LLSKGPIHATESNGFPPCRTIWTRLPRPAAIGPSPTFAKDLPTRSGGETYDSALAANRAFFGEAFLPAQAGQGLRPEFDPALPFDRRHLLAPAEAQADAFFREHYFGVDNGDPDAWRRIDNTWMTGAAEFALQLDSETNNTSLALAFELPDGRVLLFPADAQDRLGEANRGGGARRQDRETIALCRLHVAVISGAPRVAANAGEDGFPNP
jgi:hypothetical protein